MAKKGAAMIVETILLLGFIVISMVSVYFWAKSKAEKDTGKTIAGLASSLECADIRISYSCDNANMIVNNTGLLTIKNMAVRYASEDPLLIEIEITPGDSKILNDYAIIMPLKEYDVIPLVESSGKLYLCREKGLKAVC